MTAVVTVGGASPVRLPRRARTRPAVAGTARVVAGTALGIAGLLAVATVVLHQRNGDTPLTGWWYGNAALTFSLLLPAYLLATRRPANPVGWLMVGGALGEAVCGAGREYLVHGLLGGSAPGWLWAGWLADSCYLPAIVTLPMVLLLFPDGRPASPRLRLFVPVTVTSGALAWASYLLSDDVAEVRGHALANPIGRVAPEALAAAAQNVGMLGVFAGLLGGVAALVVRYRAARGAARQQVKWVVWAGALLAIELATEFVPDNRASGPASSVAVALFAAAVAIAILRHRLLDIDVVINRTVVFGVLSAAVVGTYMACVTAFAAAVDEPVHLGGGLIATALVAVGFFPARQRVQRAVDRMMYGERRNPYGVMSRLGASLEPRGSRSELTVVVDTVTQTLKLPYAAIVAPDGEVLAATGSGAGGREVAWPLVYQGESLGELRVEPRPPADRFGRDERQLLADLARQVAVAVHAVQLSADLRASRRRLVTAKEEERRRLRRDLHDGLGPRLAAVGLQLDTARMVMGERPEQAAETLAAVTAEIRSTIDDVRRLVYELRPPALDELGLVGAVRDCASRLEPGGPLIDVRAEGPLPPLPAAVEVAAYRIANEALTNVVRHAGARCCHVDIRVSGDALVVTVRDDGVGLPADVRSGVGTQSMGERAAEIGGRFALTPGADGYGTVATARLPLGRGHD